MSATHRSPAHDPAIVAPVSRFLAVADVERSMAFYRDVLGFDVQSVREGNGGFTGFAVVSGPARIQIGAHDGALDSTGERRGLREFCVLDLEGNRITFGQPFE